jgi:hypothetical protein
MRVSHFSFEAVTSDHAQTWVSHVVSPICQGHGSAAVVVRPNLAALSEAGIVNGSHFGLKAIRWAGMGPRRMHSAAMPMPDERPFAIASRSAMF